MADPVSNHLIHWLVDRHHIAEPDSVIVAELACRYNEAATVDACVLQLGMTVDEAVEEARRQLVTAVGTALDRHHANYATYVGVMGGSR